jgi:DNA-binding NtrC family response regulator
MAMEILVFDADDKQCREVCSMLEELDYRAIPMYTFQDLKKYMETSPCRIIILDLDNLPVDKKVFRKLKKINPSVSFMGISDRPFHPELEEVMSSHIYACLSRPVDEEELSFWIKSLS